MRHAVLFTGGVDSTAVLIDVLNHRPVVTDVTCFFYDYGQDNLVQERAAATRVLSLLRKIYPTKITLKKITLSLYHPSLSQVGLIPNVSKREDKVSPKTIVMWRNVLLISHAMALCEATGIHELHIGAGYKKEYSNLPRHPQRNSNRPAWDSSPIVIYLLSRLADLKNNTNYTVENKNGHTTILNIDLQKYSNEQFIDKVWKQSKDKAAIFDVFRNTRSCYESTKKVCGECSACVKRTYILHRLDRKKK